MMIYALSFCFFWFFFEKNDCQTQKWLSYTQIGCAEVEKEFKITSQLDSGVAAKSSSSFLFFSLSLFFLKLLLCDVNIRPKQKLADVIVMQYLHVFTSPEASYNNNKHMRDCYTFQTSYHSTDL